MNPLTAQEPAIDAVGLADLIEVAEDFAREVPGRLALELDAGSDEALARCWAGLAEMGLTRCLLPEAAGGAGLPDAALAPLAEAIATGDAGLAMLMLSSNIAVAFLGTEVTSRLDEDSRWAYVPAGGVRAADAALPELTGNTLTGEVGFALGACGAEGVVFACRIGSSHALAAVAGRATRMAVPRLDDQLALRCAPSGQLVLQNVQTTRVGSAAQVERADTLLHEGVAAIARGTARRARRMALEYAENRYQGGGPIITHGAVRDMLARMSEREIGMAPPADPASPVELPTALARKIAASDAAVETTIDAVQVFGGMGYMHETGVEKLMRDAKYCQLYPTPNWVARERLLETQRGRRAA